MVGIYKWTNTKDGKVYIGQSRDIEARLKRELDPVSHKPRLNEHFNRAVKRDGWKSFVSNVLVECPIEMLNLYETVYIREYASWHPDHGYNKTYGGDSGPQVPTDEIRRKMSKSAKARGYTGGFDYDHSGSNNPMYGKTHTDDTKRRIIETRKRIAASKSVYGLKGRSWYHNPQTGETRYFAKHEVVNGFVKGRGKVMKTKRWECKSRQRRIRCLDTEYIYDRLSDCAKENHFSAARLSSLKKGDVAMIKGRTYQRLD
jgi:group I intron endonuclease